jgi:hypothetical protein
MNEFENMGPDEIQRKAGQEVQQWAVALAKQLSVDDAWRLLLAGVISVMQAEHTAAEIAATLRQLAELIENGGLDQSFIN